MSLSGKRWIWPEADYSRTFALAEELGLSPALARLLVKRGIEHSDRARGYLSPALEQLLPPGLMLGMEPAVERIVSALERNEKIMVHGDYDADGIAAAVVLVELLRRAGGEVDYYLPSRFTEGYGLHISALREFKEKDFSLVVTVDCGINATAEAAYAAEIGLDLIITDHHQPLDAVQKAVAVLNPWQKNCGYPFKELTGAGIAFKLATAMAEKIGLPFPEELLDLVALGTAADVAPLVEENRVLVHAGLEVLRELKRPGMKALVEAVGLEREKINSASLSFALAPAINAAGRLGEALPAAQLLLEKDSSRGAELARRLHQTNLKRRATEKNILEEAEEAVATILPSRERKIITLAAENWHHGVIGIVASRLVDRYNHPVVLIALEGDEGRGSARSIPGFDITAALGEQGSLLERYGGHEQAAGFSIKADRVEDLKKNLNLYASKHLKGDILQRRLIIEAETDETEINFDLAEQLKQLQPYGTGNPAPLLGSRAWEIRSWCLVGAKKEHLKLQLQKNNSVKETIFFSGGEFEGELEKGRLVDFAFNLKEGFFRDRKTLDLVVKDLSYSDSFLSGHLEVIDFRNQAKRQDRLLSLVAPHFEKTIVFTATRSRAESLRKRFTKNSPVFISGGNGGTDFPPQGVANRLMLYEPPFFPGTLEMLLNRVNHEGLLKIYLLYHEGDMELNRRIMELSLPTDKSLERIISACLETGFAQGETPFSAGMVKLPDFTPAPTFWDRAEKILIEIGFIEEGYLGSRLQELQSSWPLCLHDSSTYLSVQSLWEECRLFQDMLFRSNLEDIAESLQKLISD